MDVTLAACGKPFTTFCTFKRFLSGMDTKMSARFTLCGQTLVTNFTTTVFSSTMANDMISEFDLQGETLTTYGALIRHFFSDMGAGMLYYDSSIRQLFPNTLLAHGFFNHCRCDSSQKLKHAFPQVTETSRSHEMILALMKYTTVCFHWGRRIYFRL